MTDLFIDIVIVSLVASVMFGAILLFDKTFSKTSTRLKILLYGLLALRLVLPLSWSFTLPFTLPDSIGQTNRNSDSTQEQYDQNYASDSALFKTIQLDQAAKVDLSAHNEINPDQNSSLTKPADQTKSSSLQLAFWSALIQRSQPLLSALSGIWIAGIFLILGYGLFRLLRIQYKLAAALPLTDRIWKSDQIQEPFVWGLWHWKIFVPTTMDSNLLPSIETHETTHIARLDPLWKALAFVLLAVYWFNPILWFAYTTLNKEIEKACDEQAVADMDGAAKADYASALLQCTLPGRKRQLLLVPCFGALSIKERIRLIHTPPAHSKTALAAACAMAVVLTGCLGTPAEKASAYLSMNINESDIWYSSPVFHPVQNEVILKADQTDSTFKIQAVSLNRHQLIGDPLELTGDDSVTLSNVTDDFRLWILRDSSKKKDQTNDQSRAVSLNIEGASMVEENEVINSVKTAYVGDPSAVGKVEGALPYPPDWTIESTSLQTEKEPYGMTISFNQPNSPSMEPIILSDCALFAFRSIANLQTLTFINNKADQKSIRSFDRVELMNRLQIKIGRDDIVRLEVHYPPGENNCVYTGDIPIRQGELFTCAVTNQTGDVTIDAYTKDGKCVFSKTTQIENLLAEPITEDGWTIAIVPVFNDQP
ncbi:M56 family metallopeptidase [Erysipelotrichaceae bacterium 51-3]